MSCENVTVKLKAHVMVLVLTQDGFIQPTV